MSKSDMPEKGSAQWRKNESIIAKNPFLRSLRDKSEGFSGKGSTVSTPSQAYKDGWDAIWGNKDKTDE